MNVRIEDNNGTIVYQSDFSNDAPMDPDQVINGYNSEVEWREVSFREEDNGLYDYRVIFFDDLENPDHIIASAGFCIEDGY